MARNEAIAQVSPCSTKATFQGAYHGATTTETGKKRGEGRKRQEAQAKEDSKQGSKERTSVGARGEGDDRLTLVAVASGTTGKTKARTASKLLGEPTPLWALVKGLYLASGGLVNATMKLVTTTSASMPAAGRATKTRLRPFS